MIRRLHLGLIAVLLSLGLVPSQASLIGPWFRYECQDLGFRIVVADGWKVTRVPNGVVFAMQTLPNPYVRVAVGRLPLGKDGLDGVLGGYTREAKGARLRRTNSTVDGFAAVQIEGSNAQGPFLDLFVQKNDYCYWIGFAADRNDDMWPRYAQTFKIVVDGFHFI